MLDRESQSIFMNYQLNDQSEDNDDESDPQALQLALKNTDYSFLIDFNQL